MKKEEFDEKVKEIDKDIQEVLKKHGVAISSQTNTFVACDECHKSMKIIIRL